MMLMAKSIVSNFDDFSGRFPEAVKDAKAKDRVTAVERYFKRGGVLSLAKSGSGWPKLVYPTPLRLKDQIEQLQSLRQRFQSKHRDWSKRVNDAKVYHVRNNVLKFVEPLYWKHLAKITFDADYRKDADMVKLPVHLVADKKWKPMIKMFVSDFDYRKNLAETVDKSIVYKNDKRVGRYADELQGLRKEISEKKTNAFADKVRDMETDIKMMETILRWARE